MPFTVMRKLEEEQVWNGRCRIKICQGNSGMPSRYLAEVSKSQLDKNTHLMQWNGQHKAGTFRRLNGVTEGVNTER